jgi:hypothetical protein
VYLNASDLLSCIRKEYPGMSDSEEFESILPQCEAVADRLDGQLIAGPALPYRSEVFYSVYPRPRTTEGEQEGRRRTMAHRVNVLFGQALPIDPKESCLRSLRTPPFALVPSEFLARARERRPRDPQATASAFSQWVYSLYAIGYGNEEDRDRGLEREPLIYQTRLEGQGAVDNRFLKGIGSEWRLIHNGLHMPGQAHVDYFTIDNLLVNREPLKVSPDLIYRQPRLNEVMVVEIKNSAQNIPPNLWPNVWAQLWCYAQLDVVRNANRASVIGEVWGEDKKWQGRYSQEHESVFLRASVRRDPRARGYDRFFRALFEIYCGRAGTL